MNYVLFRGGYKYQLAEDYVVDLERLALHSRPTIGGQFLELLGNGTLLVRRGYAWDGPSGPVIDRPSTMRASLVHDALYQLLRHDLLDDHSEFRKLADKTFRDICREDGVYRWLSNVYYKGLRKFGKSSAAAGETKPVLRAP